MPIHGHTKIELTNQTTGEVETIEKDNIITNAVSQIFNAFNGTALLRQANAEGEYGASSGWELLESLYGGLLLYDTALGSDPDTLFAPATAHIVGSGVPKVLNNGNGLQRGSFNSAESKTDLENGVVTFVYDFATSQANGVIASVCLTSRYGGFFDESESALSTADGACVNQYLNSSLFGQETLFPKAAALTDAELYGRPLYADAENDEMVFAAIDGSKLVLRHVTALTTEIDLFNPIGTSRVKSTQELDLSDLMQTTGSTYTAVSFDVDADKICVVCTPSGTQLKTTGQIRVRTYDRKTLAAQTYQFVNPTGTVLQGDVGGTAPGLRAAGRVLGGNLIMTGYSNKSSAVVPFFKIPLSDPTKVTAIENHGLMMPMIQDAHDGRLYLLGSKYNAFGAVLNLSTNEIHAIEAYYNGEQYPYMVVPTLNQPVTPYMARYTGSSTTRESTIHQGIRRNYLATINDLDAPVEKTADKTMKITYTLRREES